MAIYPRSRVCRPATCNSETPYPVVLDRLILYTEDRLVIEVPGARSSSLWINAGDFRYCAALHLEMQLSLASICFCYTLRPWHLAK